MNNGGLPVLGTLGQQHDAGPQRGKGTHLHLDTRQHHRDGGRGGHVTVRRPGVEGEDAAQDGEAQEHDREQPALQLGCEAGLLERQQVEGVEPGLEVDHQHAKQRHHRADEEIDGQLHAAVIARLG